MIGLQETQLILTLSFSLVVVANNTFGSMESASIIDISFPICDKKLDAPSQHLIEMHNMRCFDNLKCSYFLIMFDIFLFLLILLRED